MPRRPQVAGMEIPTRARRRKPDTAKVDLWSPHDGTAEDRAPIARWGSEGVCGAVPGP